MMVPFGGADIVWKLCDDLVSGYACEFIFAQMLYIIS
jgi:hypothetical protein